jgi:hypothetical protein
MVRCCRYLAEGAFGEFLVCPLHDAPQVAALLARGRQPHHYWHGFGRPIVLSCGPLELREEQGEFLQAFDDPMLAEIDDTPTKTIGAFCDLTQMGWSG